MVQELKARFWVFEKAVVDYRFPFLCYAPERSFVVCKFASFALSISVHSDHSSSEGHLVGGREFLTVLEKFSGLNK